MFDQLSTFNKISVVAWALMIVYFAPKIYQSWQGRAQDWIEVGWMVAAAIMVTTILLRPEWSSNISGVLVVTLVSLTLLERRSRKD